LSVDLKDTPLKDESEDSMWQNRLLGVMFVLFVIGIGYATYKATTPVALFSIEDSIESDSLVKVYDNRPDRLRIQPHPYPYPQNPEPKKKRGPVRVFVLRKNNFLTLRGPVTNKTISALQEKFIRLSARIPRKSPIMLVLNTPGGSLGAGNNLIQTIKGLSNPVDTLTLDAASMGFHIVQGLGKRYITPWGTLMSHRASLSGLRGEIPGEYIVRLKAILVDLYRMDSIVADRMGLSLSAYQDLIKDEYWVTGPEAVANKAADEVILARCSVEIIRIKESHSIDTIYGKIRLTFSACPLIITPVEVDVSDIIDNFDITEDQKKRLIRRVIALYTNKTKFITNIPEYLK